MKYLILLVVMLSSSAHAGFKIEGNASVCLSHGALSLAEESRVRDLLNPESMKVLNDCAQVPEQSLQFIIPMGVYSKARMLNYENKYKLYFISTRDLLKIRE
jgi:hypothetical protein